MITNLIRKNFNEAFLVCMVVLAALWFCRPQSARSSDDTMDTFMLWFGLIWHGFGVMLARKEGVESVFVIVCFLVSFGSYWMVGYWYCQRFLPEADLTLSTQVVHPGDVVEISWKVGAGSKKIRRLSLEFHGQKYVEETSFYASLDATDSSTITTTIWERSIPVMETSRAGEIAGGKARFTIPAGLAPTLHESARHVVWKVGLDGEMPWWRPDLVRWVEITIRE